MNFNKGLTLLRHPLKTYKICFFGITNRCNARCDFCSIWKQKKKISPSIENVKKALDFLHKNNVRFLQFTGGEPFLYKDIFEATRYASNRGFFVSVVTNGSLIDQEKAKKIKESGIDAVGVSVDHYKSEIIESTRGIKGLKDKVEKGVERLKDEGVPVFALTTICKSNYKELKEILEYERDLGVDSITLCYPMFTMDSTFEIGGSDSVNFSKEELLDVFRKVIKLKKDYKILNPTKGLKDMIRFLKKEEVKYPCLGGSKIFYLDWNLDLYKCMKKSEIICSALDDIKLELEDSQCNECMLECFRDPSIFYYGLRSLKPFYEFFGMVGNISKNMAKLGIRKRFQPFGQPSSK